MYFDFPTDPNHAFKILEKFEHHFANCNDGTLSIRRDNDFSEI